jgi:alkylated DNA repair dioxygenase AlkB
MKNYPESQLNFLDDHPADEPQKDEVSSRLVVELDQRAWMQFLGEEWLFPDSSGAILLGIDDPCDGNIISDYITVGVCFDTRALPDADILVLRQGSWINTSLRRLERTDKAVIWNGPLPLFAVASFRVPTIEDRSHLLAQVRLFADMELPSQPVEIGLSRRTNLTVPKRKNFPFGKKKAPENWDFLRGAAAMALECVPAIGPWLEVLCDMFTDNPSSASASAVNTPWLGYAPWTAQHGLGQSSLWTAIVEVFSDADLRASWRPDIVLSMVCKKARALGGNMERLFYLEESTQQLLRDLGSIQELGVKDHTLELALQLLLLRPTPERYISWKKDWPSIAPGAWWTGAILAGYLSGYRALPLPLRGGVEARKFTALRTWELSDKKSYCDWEPATQKVLSWRVNDDRFNVMASDLLIVSHKMSNRGRWHELDLQNSTARNHAEILAKEYCPEHIKRILVLAEGHYKISNNDFRKLEISQERFQVTERIEIVVGDQVQFEYRLDVDSFRSWLATAALQTHIPNPPLNTSRICDEPESQTATIPPQMRKDMSHDKLGIVKNADIGFNTPPAGLKLIDNFITSKEESSILAAIDRSVWDSSMSRRVQHYGWRYDYKAKKINSSSYIGPLPAWAEILAKKLVNDGYISVCPDQVIVNEYIGNQGIAKHIDCKSCFLGAVVTISLLESWEMIFSRKTKVGTDEKTKILLNRRSAAVIDGEARTDWFHEIPKRLKEAGVLRGRRISITFRKVNN